jgi:DNA-binding response OmpR family regulator
MSTESSIRVLLVEDNKDFANLVELYLQKHSPEKFEIVWKENGKAALSYLDGDHAFAVILMDYFLPGQNGLEISKAIRGKGITVPIVFLTVNKDFDLAVEVLKLGVEDYLVKEEISTPVLPKTILNVIEKKKLRDELTALEITEKRLEAIQGHVAAISQEMRLPLDGMRIKVDALLESHQGDNLKTYLSIIKDNLIRIEKKIVQLKEMKTDKTVQYIRDIRMFDLSE